MYRSIVGKLNFLTNTRPDLSYTVQSLSQYMQKPREPHWKALMHTLGYVLYTNKQGIILKVKDRLTLHAYSYSDWGACSKTRRSVSGYILLLGKSPVSWKSKKQHAVSKSSSEAEYRAMSKQGCILIWVWIILNQWHYIVTITQLYI